ncbi:MAG TPA: single-stranded-DNA-specific exonuclease RecJ, partial [Clostridiales bacterium]|nr:single-stranded-DNA-specific exonuclease RecJ [Clostridiales bacterium]
MSIYQVCQPDSENTETVKMLLQTELNISKITAGLLVNRGITSVEEARAYLHPTLDQLNDPFDLSGMDRAVKRVRSAVASGEKITIYGDYDADGITSSSVLSLYLKSLGADVDVYIPS